MAHFAEIDNNNLVIRVVVIANEQIIDGNGVESETLGKIKCQQLFNGGNWIQTSYNGNIRGVYAGIGYYYDEVLDKFIEPESEEIIEE